MTRRFEFFPPWIIVTFNVGSINRMKNLFFFFLILILNPCLGQNTDSLKKVVYGVSSAQSNG